MKQIQTSTTSITSPFEQYLGNADLAFDEKCRVQAFKLDLDLWRDTLWLWGVRREHQTCLLQFDVTSTCNMTRFTDLSGIGSILLTKPELRDMIIDTLSLPDVQLLRSTCGTLHDSLSTTLDRRLRRAFTPYFEDIAIFCAALRTHHAVVGGSTALSIIRPGSWHPGDLDIVVAHRYRHGMKKFLVNQGYEEITSQLGHDSIYTTQTANYGRISFDYHCYKRNGAKIDLCVIINSSLIPANYITTYHSTAVMNFYDGRSIFCLFPDETFNGVSMRNRFTPTAKLDRGLAKIRARGYQDLGVAIQERYPNPFSAHVTVDKLVRIWFMKATL